MPCNRAALDGQHHHIPSARPTRPDHRGPLVHAPPPPTGPDPTQRSDSSACSTASRDTANWWSQQFRQLPPDVRRQLAPHTPAILAALADHPATNGHAGATGVS
jgi:hypothetical protein